MRFFAKQLTAAGLLFALSCGLCACQNASSGAEDFVTLPATQTILVPSSLPENFAIQVPDAFTATSSPYYDEYYVLKDASIILSSEKQAIGGESLLDYVKDVKDAYAKTADDYKLLSEETQTIDGKAACLLEFTYAIVGDDVRQNMHCLTAVFMENETAYLVTCKSLAETFPSYKNAFRSAIQSVVITIPPAASQTAPTAPAVQSSTKSSTTTSSAETALSTSASNA